LAKASQYDRPRVACEVTADRVIAARVAENRQSLDVFASRPLPAGAITPSLGGTNLASSDAVRQAIADCLTAIAGRSREVTAVVPDAAVRLTLLDFETLPDKREEAESVVRFRLKKSLPFDVETAAISYDARRVNGNLRVLAAVALPSVIEEYESAFRNAGYNPGVLVPSMLAALGPVDASQPTLVLKVDANTSAVAIVNQDQILLSRTLDNAGGELHGERLAEDIYPSLVFFQDNYGAKVERILIGGMASADHVGSVLGERTGTRVLDLVSPGQVGSPLQGGIAPSLLAGVVGALVQ